MCVCVCVCVCVLIDDHLYSAFLRSLEQIHCARLWFYMTDKLFIARFFEYPPKWCTYSAGMAGATWNCSDLGASSVYTIQPCTMSLHAKPHKVYACLAVTCHLHFWQNDRDLLRASATAVTRVFSFEISDRIQPTWTFVSITVRKKLGKAPDNDICVQLGTICSFMTSLVKRPRRCEQNRFVYTS